MSTNIIASSVKPCTVKIYNDASWRTLNLNSTNQQNTMALVITTAVDQQHVFYTDVGICLMPPTIDHIKSVMESHSKMKIQEDLERERFNQYYENYWREIAEMELETERILESRKKKAEEETNKSDIPVVKEMKTDDNYFPVKENIETDDFSVESKVKPQMSSKTNEKLSKSKQPPNLKKVQKLPQKIQNKENNQQRRRIILRKLLKVKYLKRENNDATLYAKENANRNTIRADLIENFAEGKITLPKVPYGTFNGDHQIFDPGGLLKSEIPCLDYFVFTHHGMI